MNETTELINVALNGLKRIPGATKIFYDKFHCSRSLVYKWRKGAAKPSPEDFTSFIKTASQVIRERGSEFKEIQNKTAAAVDELKSLISA